VGHPHFCIRQRSDRSEHQQQTTMVTTAEQYGASGLPAAIVRPLPRPAGRGGTSKRATTSRVEFSTIIASRRTDRNALRHINPNDDDGDDGVVVNNVSPLSEVGGSDFRPFPVFAVENLCVPGAERSSRRGQPRLLPRRQRTGPSNSKDQGSDSPYIYYPDANHRGSGSARPVSDDSRVQQTSSHADTVIASAELTTPPHAASRPGDAAAVTAPAGICSPPRFNLREVRECFQHTVESQFPDKIMFPFF